MTTVATTVTDCLNCGVPLQGSYCAACGQKATSPRPTVHEFLHELTHEFLHVDAKIVQSVKLLFTRPGFLSREYFEGRRVRYVSPLRLYLIFSVAYFAAAALTAKPPIVTAADQKATSALRIQNREEFGRVRVSGNFGALSPEEVAERVQDAQHDWMPRIMFVLVPIAAVLVMAVTRRAGRTYIQHLYFALHTHAAMFALLAITALAGAVPLPTMLRAAFALVSLAFIVTYLLIAFRRTYGGGWMLAVARTAFVSFTYMIVVSASLIALFVGVIVM
jgi:hypothetical protein